MQVRKIQNDALKNQELGLLLFIYAVGVYDFDSEFTLIFEEMLKNKNVTAVFNLLEAKPNKIHECYIGDFLCEFRGKFLSFREILISQKITYPSRVQENLNQKIFQSRAEILAGRNEVNSILTAHNKSKVTEPNVPNEPYEPIYILGGRFHILEIVGEGSYGIVAKGRDQKTEEIIAIKMFKHSLFGFDSKKTENLNEAKLLQSINHTNVIELIDVIDDIDGLCLIFPFVGQVKICDLGLSVEFASNEYFMEICGTRSYMAPEIFLKYGYNHMIDIWATGCIVAEMKLKDIFIPRAISNKEQLINIFKVLGTPTESEWSAYNWSWRFGQYKGKQLENKFDIELLDFLNSMIRYNPSKRSTAGDLLKHQFIVRL
ncbi:cyclin-dependent kinase 5 homolog [Contarinia nasturtii]|uniref:cyclin-dependent kinase 5 homolog n=1 Tax=Contarinia nasturtii TaxID=265458 RepID=UPI0012D39A24|nr:cyclin-dependent kinase 5 homolog [Contarinia nasturtii]